MECTILFFIGNDEERPAYAGLLYYRKCRIVVILLGESEAKEEEFYEKFIKIFRE